LKKKLSILNCIGIPDDDLIAVSYNDGTLKKAKYYFPGNNAFLEGLNTADFAVQHLVLGGASQDKKLPLHHFDIIFNTICNPDTHKKSLQLLQNLSSQVKCMTVNPVSAIVNTSRDSISKLLTGLEHVIFPKTVAIRPRSRDDVLKAIKTYDFSFPVIIRSADEHGGRAMVRLDSEDDIALVDRFALDGRKYYLVQFVEYKSSDDLYRKVRFIVIGKKVIARHKIISEQWMVHTEARSELIETNEKYREEEITFVITELDQSMKEKCLQIKEKTGLDIFGIDGHILPDGSLLIFEVNACMRYFGPRQHNYIDKVTDTIDASLNQFIKDRIKNP